MAARADQNEQSRHHESPQMYDVDPVLDWFDQKVILESMGIGERGQVTIPKEIRDQFGLGPETEVEFRIVGGNIVLKKAPKKLNLAKWKGRCGSTFANTTGS